MKLEDTLAAIDKEASDRKRQACERAMRMAETDEEFEAAFQARDMSYVESLQMSEEQMGEARWETMCGCNGTDSPYHTYFGL